LLQAEIKGKFKIGIRIKIQEEPKFEFIRPELVIKNKVLQKNKSKITN
jgi:arginine decarboxylase